MDGQKRILVADDDAGSLGLFRDIFEPEGYAVTTCKVADDALRRMREARPDLLILDVRMPGREDWYLLGRVRADPALAGIPSLVCSAAVDEIGRHEARLRDAGLEVLPKPFDVEELVGTVGRLLGRPGPEAGRRRAPVG